MSVPIALAVATSTHSQALVDAAAQAADRHQVSARLLEAAPLRGGGSDNLVTRSAARAVWTGPAGTEQEGLVVVLAGTKAGSTVSIWLDADGHRTRKPLDGGDIMGRTVGDGVLTLLGLSALAFGVYAGFRAALDRSRSRRWAAEWATVEATWTRLVS